MIYRILVFVALLSNSFAEAANEPSVKFVYNETLDEVCSFITQYPIKEDWKYELKERLNELNSEWDRYGHDLLSETSSIVGKPFTFSNITARLTLCKIPSISFFNFPSLGVVVNMRYAMSSYTNDPVDIGYKTDAAYHEILHYYVADYLPKNSELLMKYDRESPVVKEHIHLFSLMKQAYLNTGNISRLERELRIAPKLNNGKQYFRAWDIVNNEVGADEFIAELSKRKT